MHFKEFVALGRRYYNKKNGSKCNFLLEKVIKVLKAKCFEAVPGRGGGDQEVLKGKQKTGEQF